MKRLIACLSAAAAIALPSVALAQHHHHHRGHHHHRHHHHHHYGFHHHHHFRPHFGIAIVPPIRYVPACRMVREVVYRRSGRRVVRWVERCY